MLRELQPRPAEYVSPDARSTGTPQTLGGMGRFRGLVLTTRKRPEGRQSHGAKLNHKKCSHNTMRNTHL
ncbi:MAG: hypothetical protein ACK53Y_04660, partial [bacterium]